jgi:hypothetical protein
MSNFGGLIMKEFMKRIYLTIMVLASSLGAMAQQEYYIFIQEPSRQPFYVRMGQESHSSSAEGHVILSKLKDSVYNLYVGFPRSRDEVLFTVAMNKKDHGYELRSENGRRKLFDLLTLQMVEPVASTLSDGQTFRRTDSYSELMASVVDDSAVLYTSPADTLTSDTALASGKVDSGTVAKVTAAGNTKSKKKKKAAAVLRDTVAAIKEAQEPADSTVTVRADTTIAADTVQTVNRDSAAMAPLAAAALPDSSVRDKRDIIRLITENIAEGKLMIYVDRSGPVNDTIRIIIPRRL